MQSEVQNSEQRAVHSAMQKRDAENAILNTLRNIASAIFQACTLYIEVYLELQLHDSNSKPLQQADLY